MKRWPNLTVRGLLAILLVVSAQQARLSKPSTAVIVPGRPEDFGR